MDPDANVAEQEAILEELTREVMTRSQRAAYRERLEELRQALTDWLARGGFPPRAGS